MKDLSKLSIADLKTIIDFCKTEMEAFSNYNIDIEADIKLVKRNPKDNQKEYLFYRKHIELNNEMIEMYWQIFVQAGDELDDRVMNLGDDDSFARNKITARKIARELIQEHEEKELNKIKFNKQDDFKLKADDYGFKSHTSISNEYYRQIKLRAKKK